MKTYGGEWSASCSCHFTPGERLPSTHFIGGWVGPRAGLDAVKRKILHWWESNPGHPARRPSLYQLSYPDSIYYTNPHIITLLVWISPNNAALPADILRPSCKLLTCIWGVPGFYPEGDFLRLSSVLTDKCHDSTSNHPFKLIIH
jgi:hypothetical protein